MDRSSVAVTWPAPSSTDGLSIEHYKIWHGSSSENLSVIATLGSHATSFKDSNLSASTTYFYAVSADSSFANLTVKKDPTLLVDVSRQLGHGSLEITQRFYASIEASDAGNRL